MGFAAKDLLANFFGGLSIYLDRPFTTGDWIRSPDRQIEGTVEDIGWRLTRIRTFDQRPLYVPNAVFSQIAVENPSRMYNRRIHETIGLRYQDADKVADIVTQVRRMLEISPGYRPVAHLNSEFCVVRRLFTGFLCLHLYQDHSLGRFSRIKQDVLLKILEIIHANGADVAFPTRTVELQHIPAGARAMKRLAIIGGTGIDELEGLQIIGSHALDTPYGAPSRAVQEGSWAVTRCFSCSATAAPRQYPRT